MLQVLLNGIIASSVYVLIGLGFGLIYGTTRFFHFAHGIVITAGAYLAFLFAARLELPLAVALALAVGGATVIGCLMELCIYRPLRRKGGSSLVLLIASLGIYIVLQNSIAMIFGDDLKYICFGTVREGINILGARITPIQFLTICCGAILVSAVALLMSRTKAGKGMRALASDWELALASGVDGEEVCLLTFAIGSVLAGVAGVLLILDIGVTPTMGLGVLLMGVTAVVIGGVGNILGIALGALFLAVVQQFGAWHLGSEWQDTIAFVVLLVFLLFKPEGFLGRKARKVTV